MAVGATSKGRSSSATTISSAGVTTQATGSTFVGFYFWNTPSGSFSSFVDNKTNVYTQIGTEITINGADHARAYYCQNGLGGAGHTMTGTITTGAGACGVMFIEDTSGLLAGILDQANQRDDTATPFTLAAGLTTAQAFETLIAAFIGNSGSNPATMAESGLGSSTIQTGTQETDGSLFFASAVATAQKSAIGTFNPSWTQSGGTGGAVFLITLKDADAGIGAKRTPFAPRKIGGPGRGKFRVATRGFTDASSTSPITGATTLTFAVTGVLTGTGALVGASTLTFSPSASLTGSGALVGASTITFSPSATIVGIGALVGASTLTFTPSASLTGTGALVGASTLTFAPSATLTGTGALTGSATITFSVTGTLADAGSGSLIGASSLTFTAVGVLTGAGALSGATTLMFSPSGVLTDAAAPPVVVTPDQPSGGYAFFNDFDLMRFQRERRKRLQIEREKEAEQIEDATTRQIAELLRAQEAKDAERAELARIQALADKYAGHAMAEGVSRRASAAILKAHEERSFNALEQMHREIERMYQEEEAAITAVLMLDTD